MRLLWLAASMKNLDVILVLLPTDGECLEVCHLISEAMPLVEQARRQRWSKPPQVIVSLRDDAAAAKLTASLTPPPLVVGPTLALPRLICEVLHPMAHWTGSFESTPMQDVLSEIMTSARDADPPRSARGGLPTTGPGSLGSLGDLGAAGGAASAGAAFCADVSPRGKEGEASAYEKLLLSPMVSPGRLGSCKESSFEEEAGPDPVSREDSELLSADDEGGEPSDAEEPSQAQDADADEAKQAAAMKAVVAEGPEAAEVESPAAGTAAFADGAGEEAQGDAQGPAHHGLDSLKHLV
mmetsp:Transcript_42586/g.141674  ORF Transcript_42586/g.141674 Transcript_42586/m.141674 type:complete len:296 (-) Transcript_42586:442-1329(-)